jgi:hypothetical protein
MGTIPFDPKNQGENFSSGFLHSEGLGRCNLLCRQSTDCCFVSGSYWYKQVSSMFNNRAQQEIIWIARNENIPSFSDEWHRWCFWSAFRLFGSHFAESFRISNSSWTLDPTRSREVSSCSAIDLAEIWWSSKIGSWMWTIMSGVVLFCVVNDETHQRWKKSPRLKCAIQFLTVAYDGACSPNYLSEWHEFPSALCLAEKIIFWQLASRCCWNRARRLTCFLSASVTRKVLQFGTWTGPSFQRHYRSVLRHREVGRAEDLLSPPHSSAVTAPTALSRPLFNFKYK